LYHLALLGLNFVLLQVTC